MKTPASPSPPSIALPSQDKLVIIGASTGGTEALKTILTQLPADFPPILIAQHMPERFTRSFAERLNSLCQIRVKEAEDGEIVRNGHAYIAPGDRHLLLARNGSTQLIRLSQDAPVNRHRPSVDVLFHSAAQQARGQAVGVILTGMGHDGAAGLLAMRRAGAHTIAQDQASCVVFGMPREAIALGAACEISPLNEIARRLLQRLRPGGRPNNS